MKQDKWSKFVVVIIVGWGAWYLYTLLSTFPSGLLALLIVITIVCLILYDLIKR